MHYEGPIYRPPSEAHSLLIQATIGCPHNKCTFCMVYKQGPAYKIRPVADIKADIDEAREQLGPHVPTIFFPAGNTIAMPTPDLAEICRYARTRFTGCRRITVYGSSQFLAAKGRQELDILYQAGLSRIHVGLESGDDIILHRTKKGADAATHIRGCRAAIEAGLELSAYVVLGLGGQDRTAPHTRRTTELLNRIQPHFVRLRTFVPKIHTLMLYQVRKGRFDMLTPHQVLEEIKGLISGIDFPTEVASDHYTNYLDVSGRLPQERPRLLDVIEQGLQRPETDFRPFFVGRQ